MSEITQIRRQMSEMDLEMRGTQPVAAFVSDEVATGGVFFKYPILHVYFWHKKLLSRDLQKKTKNKKIKHTELQK